MKKVLLSMFAHDLVQYSCCTQVCCGLSVMTVSKLTPEKRVYMAELEHHIPFNYTYL